MKTLKKLPFLLAFVITLFAAACSDINIEPVGTEDDDEPILIGPAPKSTSTVESDTVSIN